VGTTGERAQEFEEIDAPVERGRSGELFPQERRIPHQFAILLLAFDSQRKDGFQQLIEDHEFRLSAVGADHEQFEQVPIDIAELSGRLRPVLVEEAQEMRERVPERPFGLLRSRPAEDFDEPGDAGRVPEESLDRPFLGAPARDLSALAPPVVFVQVFKP